MRHAWRWFLRGHRMPLILDDEFAIRAFQDVHPQSGVAGTFPIRKQLQDPPVILHRVVPAHLAGVLEAEGLGEAQVGGYRAVGGIRMLGLHGETGVEAGQKVPQHGRGLANGPGISQAQFGYQPVLKGLCHALHPALGLG